MKIDRRIGEILRLGAVEADVVFLQHLFGAVTGADEDA
jgi:hypothetical protein